LVGGLIKMLACGGVSATVPRLSLSVLPGEGFCCCTSLIVVSSDRTMLPSAGRLSILNRHYFTVLKVLL
jgi:hypothetical protein